MDQWTDRQTNQQMKQQINGWSNGELQRGMDRLMDEQTDTRTDGHILTKKCKDACERERESDTAVLKIVWQNSMEYNSSVDQ